ncbi:MAG: glycosyltransferase family 39 protein [Phycisphaerales bacterium]|nr:MAG: glycosyltransferase family 39 protein [Phycisphaerales bacterium]
MNSELAQPSKRFISIRLHRRDAMVATALATIFVIAGACRLVVGVCGVYHDDAIYVSTAKALAQGDGYRLISLPGAPIQTKYPVVYPALLSLVWRIWPRFPDNLLAMQGLSLLAGAAAVGVAYLYLVRFGYFSRRVAAASGLLCATVPFMLYISTQTLSEAPFALLVLLAMWTLECQVRRRSSSRLSALVLGVVLGLPFLCRSIGVTLIPAGLVILYRARHRTRWVMCGLAGVTLPWVLWSLAGWGVWRQGPVNGYYADYAGWWTSSGLPFLKQVILSNLVVALSASASLGLEGLSTWLGQLASPLSFVLFATFGLLLWISVFRQLRTHLVLPCFLIAYSVPILLCPWPPHRFLVPVLPLLLAYLVRIISALLGPLLRIRRIELLPLAGLGVAIAANVLLQHRHCELSRRTGYPYTGIPAEPVAWRSYEDVFAWLRTHAQPDDVVASGFDSMIYLYTDLRAFRPFRPCAASLFYGVRLPPVGTCEDLVRTLRVHQPRYLVQLPLPGFSEDEPFAELVNELHREYPGWLTTAYQSDDRRFVIFELNPEKQLITDVLSIGPVQ